MSSEPTASGPSRSLWGPRIAGLMLLALGALILNQTFRIGQGAGYIVIGPRFFPTIVAFGLLLLGVIFLLRTTVFPDFDLAEETAQEEAATHWPTVLYLLAVLIIYAFLLHPLGYALATTFFFPVVSRILGSRKPLRDLIIGLTLGFFIYLAFTRVLGVRLPAGLLSGIL